MISFKKLWEAHPTIVGKTPSPCITNGVKNFSNQCAIRVGVALAANGVKTSSIPGATHCWHGGHKKSEGHVIRAEELAIGLSKLPINGIRKTIKITPEDFAKQISGRNGIIFFKDYWQRPINGTKKKESVRNRSGDHIDLWNGSRLTKKSSWARIHLRIGNFGLHTISDEFSDLENSKSIWFWEIPQ